MTLVFVCYGVVLRFGSSKQNGPMWIQVRLTADAAEIGAILGPARSKKAFVPIVAS